MSDTLAKIRAEILTIRGVTVNDDARDGLNAALLIIDSHLAAERKPRGEWKHGYDSTRQPYWFWELREGRYCEVQINTDGMFVSCAYLEDNTTSTAAIHTNIKAAQLAAEDAMDEMEKKQ